MPKHRPAPPALAHPHVADGESPPGIDCPPRCPASARLVGQLEMFSQSPMHQRTDRYLLSTNRSRTHWLLWRGFHNDSAWRPQWEYFVCAYIPRAGVPAVKAARALLECDWHAQRECGHLTHRPERIEYSGLLSDDELRQIAAAVWPLASERPPSCALFDAPRTLIDHFPTRAGVPLRAVRPDQVERAADLPPYLLLGCRDDMGFRLTEREWSQRWRGLEPETWLRWSYLRDRDQSIFEWRWCGIFGGAVSAAAGEPPQFALGRLYNQHARAEWELAAARRFMERYRLHYVPAMDDATGTLLFPDGPLRCVVVPLPLPDAQRFADEWPAAVRAARMPFPLVTHLLRVRCDAAYLEGKAAVGPSPRAELATRCERATGLPAGEVRAVRLTVRTRAPGAALERLEVDGYGWEVEQQLPCAVTVVPFAGLSSALALLESAGVLAAAGLPAPQPAAPLPDPVVVPLEVTAGGRVALWVAAAAMRLTWHFRGLPEMEDREEVALPKGSNGEPLRH